MSAEAEAFAAQFKHHLGSMAHVAVDMGQEKGLSQRIMASAIIRECFALAAHMAAGGHGDRDGFLKIAGESFDSAAQHFADMDAGPKQ